MRAAHPYEVVTFRGVQIIAVPLKQRPPANSPCDGCIYNGDCPDDHAETLPSCVSNDVVWNHLTEELKIKAVTAKLTSKVKL